MTGDALGTRCYLFALLLIQKRGEFSRLQSRCIEWGWGLVSTRGLVGHTRGLIGHTSWVVGHMWGLLGHTASLGHRACRVKRSLNFESVQHPLGCRVTSPDLMAIAGDQVVVWTAEGHTS